MGIFSALLQRDQRDQPGMGDVNLVHFLRGGGESINPNSAMQIATVFTCARIVSEAVMMLPLELRAELPDGGSRRATEHPVYQLLSGLANDEMTARELRQTVQCHLVQWGNGYLQKVPDNKGTWMQLWPLRPDRMEIKRGPNGDLIYEYQVGNGKKITFRSWEIMHIRGMSPDGINGYSPIGMARRTIEAKDAMDEYQESFYENGARPGMVLKHPGKLSDKAYSRLLESWENRHKGAANANKLAILEEGMAAEDIGIPQSDAEFLATQKFSREEICALFRVPTHLVNDSAASSYASREQAMQDFVTFSINPSLVLWEDAISRDLLTPAERKTYYANHKRQALLQSDNEGRATFYNTLLMSGVLCINDVRILEDLNPIPGGNTYFVPLNMVPLEQAIKGQPTDAPAGATSARALIGAHGHGRGGAEQRAAADDDTEVLRLSRVEMARSMQPVLEDIATRVVKRESRDMRKAVDKFLRKRANDEFDAWLTDFYAEFSGVVEDNFRAALMTMARQAMLAAAAELGEKSKGLTDGLRAVVNEYLATLGSDWAQSSRAEIEVMLADALASGVDPGDAIDERLTRWEETKPGKAAERHSFDGLNAFVLQSYRAYSITRYAWLAGGDACQFCRQLSGQSAGIDEQMVGEGTQLDGGDSGQMTIKHALRHGPLHGGCNCVTRAVR